jgi:hypothetical protein
MTDQWTVTGRLVLPDDATEEDVHNFAMSLGWPLQNEIPANTEEGTSRELVWHDDPSISMHFYEDEISGFDFIIIIGEDPDAVHTTQESVEGHLHTWRPSELLESFAGKHSDDELAQVTIRAGLGAPKEFDQAFFEAIRNSARNSHDRVREAAVWAMSYRPWPAYRSVLEERASTDPDLELRKLAAAVLEEYDDAGIGRT